MTATAATAMEEIVALAVAVEELAVVAMEKQAEASSKATVA